MRNIPWGFIFYSRLRFDFWMEKAIGLMFHHYPGSSFDEMGALTPRLACFTPDYLSCPNTVPHGTVLGSRTLLFWDWHLPVVFSGPGPARLSTGIQISRRYTIELKDQLKMHPSMTPANRNVPNLTVVNSCTLIDFQGESWNPKWSSPVFKPLSLSQKVFTVIPGDSCSLRAVSANHTSFRLQKSNQGNASF